MPLELLERAFRESTKIRPGLDQGIFARRLAEALSAALRQEEHAVVWPSLGTAPNLPGVEILDVRIEWLRDDFDVVVLFADERRPRCRFAYVWRGLWNQAVREEEQISASTSRTEDLVGEDTVASFTTNMFTSFEERLMAGDQQLPRCRPGETVILEEPGG